MSLKCAESSFGIVLKEDKVLLTLRTDVSVWVLPGGGIEKKETPEEACHREIFEETGVRIDLQRQSHELLPLNKLANPTYLFIATPRNDPVLTSSESRENKYFSINNLPKNLFFAHKIWIEEALSKEELIKRPLYEITYQKAFFNLLRHPFQTLRFAWTRLTKQ